MIFLEKPENFNPKCEVVGCFLEHQGQILLLHRQDHKSEGNTWGIPGGKIEKNESPSEAAIRETLSVMNQLDHEASFIATSGS